MEQELYRKLENLKGILRKLEKVAVAYSGGVDSTFLLMAAKEVLGGSVFAITVKIHSFPEEEYDACLSFCDEQEIRHCTIQLNELDIPGFSDNPKNRCYLCKKKILSSMIAFANAQGGYHLIEGSNLDDEGDYRPGLQAIKELGVKSPLKEAGLTKQDIRLLSKQMGLDTWNKPALACLSTRIPYGESITMEKLSMIEAGEKRLHQYGISQARVRCHGKLARVEVLPEEFPIIMDENIRSKLVEGFQELGFSYVSLDLQGYRTGSMNEQMK
ncbi:MAG: ATP-dependent sacrificial sulfur transferase LarE [Lachnospiraceae bacterium]